MQISWTCICIQKLNQETENKKGKRNYDNMSCEQEEEQEQEQEEEQEQEQEQEQERKRIWNPAAQGKKEEENRVAIPSFVKLTSLLSVRLRWIDVSKLQI